MELLEFYKETTERYYNRFINMYKTRMVKANDKEYTHQKFFSHCNAILEFKFGFSYRETIIQELDDQFKLGKDFSIGIKALRKYFKKQIGEASFEYIGMGSDLDDYTFIKEITTSKKSDDLNSEVANSNNFNLDNIEDKEIVRIYAEYKAYLRFNEFLNIEAKNFELDNIDDQETKNYNKEHTTSRQVLAIHYLFQYTQVKNIDKTEVAKYIQFLTSKSYDNIYKKVLKLQNLIISFKINFNVTTLLHRCKMLLHKAFNCSKGKNIDYYKVTTLLQKDKKCSNVVV